MTPEKVRKLGVLSRQLTEFIMGAALCAREIADISQDADADGGKGGGNGRRRDGTAGGKRPLVDEATLSVFWRGKTLHLGHIKGFWLLARLARRVNQYVTHTDLLREIWDDEFADTALLRAGMKRLRVKLRAGGMSDLAKAITGHHGRYMLDLDAARHREVTAMYHRTSRP